MDDLLYAEYTKAGHAMYKAMFYWCLAMMDQQDVVQVEILLGRVPCPTLLRSMVNSRRVYANHARI